MHHDAVHITETTVKKLLHDQVPNLADLPVVRLNSAGTVNTIFRLGNNLTARFPMRLQDVERHRKLLEAEVAASAEFARHSPVPSPTPITIGRPGAGFPMHWSIQTWIPGSVAEGGAVASSNSFAIDLAMLVKALRRVGTNGRTFAATGRGGDLRNHDRWVRKCFHESKHLLDVPKLMSIWERLVELPRHERDVMSHGDLTPSNVLVDRGRLSGLLDCGGFGPADPSLDLIAAWHLLDDERRALFRSELMPTELEWQRGKAWAFEQSIGAVWYYIETNPAMYEMGRFTLDRIVADEE